MQRGGGRAKNGENQNGNRNANTARYFPHLKCHYKGTGNFRVLVVATLYKRAESRLGGLQAVLRSTVVMLVGVS